jgi:hypothetical protein
VVKVKFTLDFLVKLLPLHSTSIILIMTMKLLRRQIALDVAVEVAATVAWLITPPLIREVLDVAVEVAATVAWLITPPLIREVLNVAVEVAATVVWLTTPPEEKPGVGLETVLIL